MTRLVWRKAVSLCQSLRLREPVRKLTALRHIEPSHAVQQTAWLLFLRLDYNFNVDACIGKL